MPTLNAFRQSRLDAHQRYKCEKKKNGFANEYYIFLEIFKLFQ